VVADLNGPSTPTIRYFESHFTEQDINWGAEDFHLKMIWEHLAPFDEFPFDRLAFTVDPRGVPSRKLNTCCVACSRGG
jgi:hypothetical protein